MNRQSEAGTGSVLALSLDESIEHSRKLAAVVRAQGFVPDLVVGICEGGILPAHVVAGELGARFACVRVRRPSSALKHSLPGRVAAWALKSIYHRSLLFRRMTELANRGRGRSVELPPDCKPRPGERRVLIVDDFSESGRTFVVAAETIKAGAADLEVRSAALTVLPGLQGAVFEPEYSLSRAWMSFPWSTDSSDYSAYQGWKRERSLTSA
jgi:hypoxanthine phosphoribosyltransferase